MGTFRIFILPKNTDHTYFEYDHDLWVFEKRYRWVLRSGSFFRASWASCSYLVRLSFRWRKYPSCFYMAGKYKKIIPYTIWLSVKEEESLTNSNFENLLYFILFNTTKIEVMGNNWREIEKTEIISHSYGTTLYGDFIFDRSPDREKPPNTCYII